MALRITGNGFYQDLTWTIFLFLLSFTIFTVSGVEGQEINFEDLDLDEKLKILNKPHVKSIQTEDGDIFDCVNINKQPAFDHPLLKNHKIQMEPSSSLKEMIIPVSSSSKPFEIGITSMNCPFGTVPIKRTRKEDLISAKMFTKSVLNSLTSFNRTFGFHYAVKILTSSPSGKYLGASGQLNIQNPNVPEGQFSEAFIRLQNGPEDTIDSIQVGWMVNPTLSGDDHTRSFAFWTNGKDGCFDIMCPGFVQVNHNLSLSSTFSNISVFGGKQYDFTYTVSQDPKSGNWWLKYGEQDMGYWPNSLFTHLSSSATEIIWGGGVFSGSSPEDTSPPMGTGSLAEAHFGKAAYIRQLKIVDESNTLRYPDKKLFQLVADCPCYDLGPLSGIHGAGFGFLYGGPGGCPP